MDGTLEDKQFAPGYGEFRAEVKADDELYNVALAVPTDSLPGRAPNELTRLTAGAGSVFEAAPAGRWEQLGGKVDAMERAWERFRKGSVPPLLSRQMDASLDDLETAVDDHQIAETRQAAIDVGHAGLDLELRYRPQADVDRDRLALWEDQLVIDRAAGDAGAVAGDQVTIETIRDRIR